MVPGKNGSISLTQLAMNPRPSPRCQLWNGSGTRKEAGKVVSCVKRKISGSDVHGAVVPTVYCHSPFNEISSHGTPGTPASQRWQMPVHGFLEVSLFSALKKDLQSRPILTKKGQSPFMNRTAPKYLTWFGPSTPLVARSCRSSINRLTRVQ